MPNRNKQRGYELEKETVDAMRAAGVECKRVLSSGAFKHYDPDLEGDIKLAGHYTVEAKRKKSGFKFLYDALDQDSADLVVVRQDRARRIWILEEDTLIDLLTKAGLVSKDG